ncbi:MAG: phytoene/squalene synthase family protein [Planctomycetota bacterium]|nr:phytoene/squalene synthase family protein [Planctomycetota bacterium]
MHNALQVSYQNCERIARTSGSNFYRSFSLLRPQKRQAMLALYAYARVIDDLGDSPKSLNTKLSNSEHGFDSISLHKWIDNLVSNSTKSNCVNHHSIPGELSKIQLALNDAVANFDIPLDRLHEMVEGVAMDQVEHVRILDSFAFDRYCYLVASSVGLACLSIWRGDVTKFKDAAIDCGFAFQLTNIIRDVAEDAKQDRIYFPTELLESNQIDQAAWINCAPNGNWEAMLRSQIDRAKALYSSGWRIHPSLDSDGQRMFSLMWHTYYRLLLKIESNIGSIWTRRTRLGRLEKLQLYFQHAITPSYFRFNQDATNENASVQEAESK